MKQWTHFLFLDRDGVINSCDDGFVNKIEDFKFAPRALEALTILSNCFSRIFVVTNQAGIGYGYLSMKELESIHAYMINEVESNGGRIDRVYYCPDRVSKSALCRKPNSGMALLARADFPEVDFQKSWMVGDRESDIEFGARLLMKTVRIAATASLVDMQGEIKADYYFENLIEFALFIKNMRNFNATNR